MPKPAAVNVGVPLEIMLFTPTYKLRPAPGCPGRRRCRQLHHPPRTARLENMNAHVVPVAWGEAKVRILRL